MIRQCSLIPVYLQTTVTMGFEIRCIFRLGREQFSGTAQLDSAVLSFRVRRNSPVRSAP